MSVLRAIVRAVPVVTAGLGGALVFAVGYILIAGSTGRSPDKEPWIVDSVLGYLTIASVGAAVGYLAFRAWKGGSEQGGLAKFLLTVVFSALSGIGAVGTAVVLIFKFASIWDRPRNAKPESAQDAQLAIVILLLVLVIVATVLVVAWARRIEHAGVIGAVVGVFLFDAALIWGVPALVGRGGDVHDPPRGPAAARYLEGFRLRHEVMLVIDPGEPGGRRLIRQLKDEPETLTQERDGIARWNVATGVAVPAANGGSMSIEQKPTTSRRDLLAAIRDIPLARRPASLAADLGAIRTLTGDPGAWATPGTVRTVAWIVGDLPRVSGPAAKGPLGELPHGGSQPTLAKRKRYVPLQIVAADGSPRLRKLWNRAAEQTGGSLVLPESFSDDRQAIDMAEDAATGRPDSVEEDLATTYRPYLKFDRAEPYRPLDIDAYFREPDIDTGEPAHEQCTDVGLTDSCTPVRDPSELRASAKFLETPAGLTEDAAITSDVGRKPPTTERIYYHRSPESDGKIQLDYWWFLRFNSSPVAPQLMCLRGLAIKETTCFDHEGDWEGVTVTLRRDKDSVDGWAPDSVSYAGHFWRYRYLWPWLQHANAVEGRTHAVVYVARGSHAAYPAKCTHQGAPRKGTCHQIGRLTPDGRRNPAADGKSDWEGNGLCDNCVLPLPTDPLGQPALWNAFTGLWGAPACTIAPKLCVRAAGPETPSRQGRYKHPEDATPGVERDLYERAGVAR